MTFSPQLEAKFAKLPQIAEANLRAFKAGFNYGETAEIFDASYVVRPTGLRSGIGNTLR